MLPDAAYAGSVESVSDFTSRPPMKKLPWRAMVRGPGSGRGVCAAAQTTIEQKLVAISTARMRRSFPRWWRVLRHLSCRGFRDPDPNPAFGHTGSDDILALVNWRACARTSYCLPSV